MPESRYLSRNATCTCDQSIRAQRVYSRPTQRTKTAPHSRVSLNLFRRKSAALDGPPETDAPTSFAAPPHCRIIRFPVVQTLAAAQRTQIPNIFHDRSVQHDPKSSPAGDIP